jgi:hypothetical protein
MSSQGQDAGIQCQVGQVTTTLYRTVDCPLHSAGICIRRANFCLFPPGHNALKQAAHWTIAFSFLRVAWEHDRSHHVMEE